KLELVEAEFRRSYPVSGKSSDTKEQALNTRLRAFKRAVEDAVIKKGVIVTREIHDVQWVWLASHRPSEDTGPTKNALRKMWDRATGARGQLGSGRILPPSPRRVASGRTGQDFVRPVLSVRIPNLHSLEGLK